MLLGSQGLEAEAKKICKLMTLAAPQAAKAAKKLIAAVENKVRQRRHMVLSVLVLIVVLLLLLVMLKVVLEVVLMVVLMVVRMVSNIGHEDHESHDSDGVYVLIGHGDHDWDGVVMIMRNMMILVVMLSFSMDIMMVMLVVVLSP